MLRRADIIIIALFVCCASTSAQDFKTVIGPSNLDLADGANLLLAGRAEEGLEKTLRGLRYATTKRERLAGNSNACAGYVMLDQPEAALPYCDEALDINHRHWRALTNRALAQLKLGRFEQSALDLQKAEEIAPSARSVRLVRAMYLDATDPVAPHVVVDDRRQGPDDDDRNDDE